LGVAAKLKQSQKESPGSGKVAGQGRAEKLRAREGGKNAGPSGSREKPSTLHPRKARAATKDGREKSPRDWTESHGSPAKGRCWRSFRQRKNPQPPLKRSQDKAVPEYHAWCNTRKKPSISSGQFDGNRGKSQARIRKNEIKGGNQNREKCETRVAKTTSEKTAASLKRWGERRPESA